jgi:hypothetical protein
MVCLLEVNVVFVYLQDFKEAARLSAEAKALAVEGGCHTAR